MKISVTIKPEIDKLVARGTGQNRYLSDILNDVLQCGLLAIEESEADDPKPTLKLVQ
jgi:hypothetical protein